MCFFICACVFYLCVGIPICACISICACVFQFVRVYFNLCVCISIVLRDVPAVKTKMWHFYIGLFSHLISFTFESLGGAAFQL